MCCQKLGLWHWLIIQCFNLVLLFYFHPIPCYSIVCLWVAFSFFGYSSEFTKFVEKCEKIRILGLFSKFRKMLKEKKIIERLWLFAKIYGKMQKVQKFGGLVVKFWRKCPKRKDLGSFAKFDKNCEKVKVLDILAKIGKNGFIWKNWWKRKRKK